MDKLGVINLALLKCGLPLAASLTDCDYNAAMIFDLIAEQNLKLHRWGFAQKIGILDEAATKPLHSFEYAYLRPADCVDVIEVRPQPDIRTPKATMMVNAGLVYTNAKPCYARYTFLQMDPEFWPADFTDAVACNIAFQIAPLSAEKMALAPQLFQFYQAALSLAMANDAREETVRVPLNESLYSGRGRSE